MILTTVTDVNISFLFIDFIAFAFCTRRV